MLDCFSTERTPDTTPIDLIPSQAFDAWLARQDGFTANWARANDFRGQAGRLLMIPAADTGTCTRIVFGLGADDDPMLPAELPEHLRDGDYTVEGGMDGRNPDTLALAWALGTYQFTAYRKNAKRRPRLVLPQGVTQTVLTRMVEGLFLTRDLINTPANDLGPAELERAARDLAERHNGTLRVVSGDQLLEENFPLIHAVGRASSRPPRLLDITWGQPDAPKLTLVGKGVSFDTGGLNIKPSSGLELMKKDMGGAAHVMGLGHMIMGANLPVRLRILVPAVENAISGDAFRPGDVYRSRKGLTVEIGNTDAEGRLILADALTLAEEDAPDLMLVMATLTGAARVALGPDVIPFYTDDAPLAEAMTGECAAAGEFLWRMPLHKPYNTLLESRTADINHISPGRFAGSITAALFLARFAGGVKSWAHFDIYAWNGQARPGRPIGGEAQALKGLFRMLQKRYGAAAPPANG